MMIDMPPKWIDGQPNPEYNKWYHANKPKDLGPSSDFGWQDCHGCERVSDRWPYDEHAKDCPGVCIRENCDWHKDSGD
jgi:hypothetical protein